MARQIETHSINYIPLAERHGHVWHLWPIWFMGNAHLATVATGVIGGAIGGTMIWMAIAVVTGCIFGTFFMAFHSTQGPQLGLAQMIQSRPQFGYIGALLVWIVALITYIGFNAFNAVLMAQTVTHLTSFSYVASILVFTVVTIFMAIVGHDWIHWMQQWFSAILIVVLGAFSIGAVMTFQFDAAQWDLANFKAIPFLVQFFAAASYQISWSIYVSDYSRYLPPNVGVRASFCYTYFGALTGATWMMLIGVVAVGLNPSFNVAEAVQAAGDTVYPGFGLFVLLASLAGLFSINALNFYGASLTLLSVVETFHKLSYTLMERFASLAVLGLIAFGIAVESSEDFAQKFGDLLAVLLYLFTPWTAINLIDFYVVRKGHYSVREIFNPDGMYGRWNWRGLVAYGVGFVAMIPFFSTGLYTGPIAKMLGGADIAMVIGLPISAFVYLWACRSMDVVADREEAARADIGLDAEIAAEAAD